MYKFIYELLPILIFFILFKTCDIYIATVFAMITISLQIGITLFKKQKPELMQIVSLVMILVLGSATLFFKNELFIKWKPTAVYWVLSLAFFASSFVGKKTLIEYMLGKNLNLPKPKWHSLNFSWVMFFLTMGGLNLYVVYFFDTNTWVNFKLFGTMGLTFAFIILQAIYINKYIDANNT